MDKITTPGQVKKFHEETLKEFEQFYIAMSDKILDYLQSFGNNMYFGNNVCLLLRDIDVLKLKLDQNIINQERHLGCNSKVEYDSEEYLAHIHFWDRFNARDVKKESACSFINRITKDG